MKTLLTCVIAKNSPEAAENVRFFSSGISMKRVSQLTALALLIGLAASTSFAAETMPTLTLSRCNSSTASRLIHA
jgi:hypothetical protein